MGTPHKHAEVIKAWADGADIQVKLSPGHRWDSAGTPTWKEDYEYRVKPANVERYCPIIVMPAGSVVIGCGKTEQVYAISHAHDDRRTGDVLAGVLHVTINPDTLELVSAEIIKEPS